MSANWTALDSSCNWSERTLHDKLQEMLFPFSYDGRKCPEGCTIPCRKKTSIDVSQTIFTKFLQPFTAPPPSHKYCTEHCVATVSGISQLNVSLMSRDPRRRAKWRETLPIVTLTHRATFVWQRVNFFRNMTNREETNKKKTQPSVTAPIAHAYFRLWFVCCCFFF